MSDEVDRVLAQAAHLRRAFGRFWAVVVTLYALRTVRKKGGLFSTLTKLGLLGVGGYGYWIGFFS
jgi:hypothetical protein